MRLGGDGLEQNGFVSTMRLKRESFKMLDGIVEGW